MKQVISAGAESATPDYRGAGRDRAASSICSSISVCSVDSAMTIARCRYGGSFSSWTPTLSHEHIPPERKRLDLPDVIHAATVVSASCNACPRRLLATSLLASLELSVTVAKERLDRRLRGTGHGLWKDALRWSSATSMRERRTRRFAATYREACRSQIFIEPGSLASRVSMLFWSASGIEL